MDLGAICVGVDMRGVNSLFTQFRTGENGNWKIRGGKLNPKLSDPRSEASECYRFYFPFSSFRPHYSMRISSAAIEFAALTCSIKASAMSLNALPCAVESSSATGLPLSLEVRI